MFNHRYFSIYICVFDTTFDGTYLVLYNKYVLLCAETLRYTKIINDLVFRTYVCG